MNNFFHVQRLESSRLKRDLSDMNKNVWIKWIRLTALTSKIKHTDEKISAYNTVELFSLWWNRFTFYSGRAWRSSAWKVFKMSCIKGTSEKGRVLDNTFCEVAGYFTMKKYFGTFEVADSLQTNLFIGIPVDLDVVLFYETFHQEQTGYTVWLIRSSRVL